MDEREKTNGIFIASENDWSSWKWKQMLDNKPAAVNMDYSTSNNIKLVKSISLEILQEKESRERCSNFIWRVTGRRRRGRSNMLYRFHVNYWQKLCLYPFEQRWRLLSLLAPFFHLFLWLLCVCRCALNSKVNRYFQETEGRKRQKRGEIW